VNRLPTDLVLTMLRQSGRAITASGLRNWTARGLITRTPDGYDPVEVADAHDTVRVYRRGKLTTGQP
jgi:hypothetical protein